MKLKSHLYFFCIPLLLFFTNCRKETALDKLPPATQEGKNTFGCLVNGKAWMPDNGCDLLCPKDLKFYYDFDNGGTFNVVAELSVGSKDERIVFGFYPCNQVGIKSFTTGDLAASITYRDYTLTNCLSYYSSKENNTEVTGYVNITRLDLANRVISGSFEFTLNKPGCETLNITDGRFDGKL